MTYLRRLLVQVNPVAIQVLECYSRAIRLNLRLAVELDPRVLHSAVFPQAVIGHDPEERLGPCLLADQCQISLRFRKIEGDRWPRIAWQPESDPALRSEWHVLRHDE